MFIIYTAFDKSQLTKPKMLASIIYNTSTNQQYVFPLYVKGNKETLSLVLKKTKYIKSIISTKSVMVNDFKSHIMALDLPINDLDYQVQEIPIEDYAYPRDWESLQPLMLSKFEDIKNTDCNKWRSLMAEATLVYCNIERRGVIHENDFKVVHPFYQFITTGRSSTSIFNIQGMKDGTIIKSTMKGYDWFIGADWLSADLRAAAIISGDEKLLGSFDKSDPYTELSQSLNISRDECKNRTLPGLYSLNLNSDIFKYYKTFKGWAESSIALMDKQGYLTSILGRKFYIKGDTDQQLLDSRRQVFNAQMQGTVAHAMHNVLIQMHKKYPYSILTELHDSIILCCNDKMVKDLISDVSNIMIQPFKGILPSNPTFPLRVYIGNRWRPSQLYKVIRSCNG